MRTIVKAIVSAAMLFVVCASSFSQQVAKTIPNSTSPDGLIGFLEFRPSDYGSQKHPLIIFLHGIGERGNGTSQINYVSNNAIPKFCAAGASMRFTVAGQTSSFVVLSPQLSTQYGYWPTFYVREMIKYAKANLSIDPNRIYITGLSLGGGGTWRAITDATGWDYTFDAGIAAAAPVCGTQEETDADFCGTIGANHLPVWNFHSMDDGTVGVGASQHAEILAKNCGITPAINFTYYQYGGHVGAWLNAYDTGHITTTLSDGSSFTANPNLYEWLLSNTRSTTPVYTAPVANAGAAQVITLPLNTVTLTGSGSGTNGASIAAYSWTKTSGPSGGLISLPLLNTTLVTGLVQGTYVFTLTVTDNHGLSSSSTVTITVNPQAFAPNQLPVANAGTNQTITLPSSSVTLDGTASKDPDGYITGFHWTQTGGPAGPLMSNSNNATTNVTGLVAGTYTYVLEVTDNGGLKAYSSVYITVNPAPAAPAGNGNQLPVANAGVNQSITLPSSSVTLDGSASKDPDGYIAGYHWTMTSGPDGSVMSSRDAATTGVTALLQGVYHFVLEVTDNSGLKSYSETIVTVNAATAPPPPSGTLLGYVKLSWSADMACADASTSGRIAVYGNGIANANLLYLDAQLTQIFDGGWNWYSFTPVLGGQVTQAFAVFPNGGIALLTTCAPGTAPAPPPPPPSNLLGYIKMTGSSIQACADASSSGRTAVYGTSVANGSVLYTDAALTQKFNGGWNWFSFTPVLGGATTSSFAVYPIGVIFLMSNCSSGARIANITTTTVQDEAALKLVKDAAITAVNGGITGRLNMYPNPVRNKATVEYTSTDNSVKTIHLYNASGVLTAKYNWPTTKGQNVFSMDNVAGLTKGLYIIDIRDSNGKTVGKLKFIKM